MAFPGSVRVGVRVHADPDSVEAILLATEHQAQKVVADNKGVTVSHDLLASRVQEFEDNQEGFLAACRSLEEQKALIQKIHLAKQALQNATAYVTESDSSVQEAREVVAASRSSSRCGSSSSGSNHSSDSGEVQPPLFTYPTPRGSKTPTPPSSRGSSPQNSDSGPARNPVVYLHR